MITTDISSDTVFKLAVAFNRNSHQKPSVRRGLPLQPCPKPDSSIIPVFFQTSVLFHWRGWLWLLPLLVWECFLWLGSLDREFGTLVKMQAAEQGSTLSGPRHPTQHLLDVPKSESAYCGPFKSGLESCGCV